MIYLTGDTHAEFQRFAKRRFFGYKGLNKNDMVIVLGDFGGIWCSNDRAKFNLTDKMVKEEMYWLNWLSHLPFKICWVDGNHENYDRIYSDEFETVDFYGGKAQKIRDNIFHLMRGEVYEIEGKKFFVMGGARSHDISDGIVLMNKFERRKDLRRFLRKLNKQNKEYRIEHASWWSEEIPSKEEMQNGVANLEKNNWRVDYVLTHCLPQSIAAMGGFFDRDKLSIYFDELLSRGLEFKEWHCGHYHCEMEVAPRFSIHYKSIVPLDPWGYLREGENN